MNKEVTICKKCRCYIQKPDSRPTCKDIWYNQLCGASPLPVCIDYVTGKISDSIAFEYCRSINTDGCCKKFIPLGKNENYSAISEFINLLRKHIEEHS